MLANSALIFISCDADISLVRVENFRDGILYLRFSLTQIKVNQSIYYMFFDFEPYPPGNWDKGDCFGRQLLALPNKAVKPSKTYAINNTFVLSLPQEPPPPEFIKVTIVELVQIGYSLLNQCLIVQAEEGPQKINGRNSKSMILCTSIQTKQIPNLSPKCAVQSYSKHF